MTRRISRGSPTAEADRPRRPSLFYRSGSWRAGLAVTRVLPDRLAVGCARAVAAAYARARPRRLEVVADNLAPLFGGDRNAARPAARRLFRNFAGKLVHLLQFENGRPVTQRFSRWTGWEHFEAARASGRGVLLLTPHLGNWEFGAPLLAERGVPLLVVTGEEPGENFTRLRERSRARWNIETVVVGRDPFSFLPIVRRLEAGGTVALLIDRPPAGASVRVDCFGRGMAASLAPVELARACHCSLVPVAIPLTPDGYAALLWPAIPYERACLRQPDARRDLTQRIVRAFEPAIREYSDQWYHFIPVWDDD